MKLKFRKKYRGGEQAKINKRNRRLFSYKLLSVPVPNMLKRMNNPLFKLPLRTIRMRRYNP